MSIYHKKLYPKVQYGKRVLIIGGGHAGKLVIEELKNKKHLQKIPVAILDDDKAKLYKRIYNVPIISAIEGIGKVTKDLNISEIIIALPSASRNRIREIVDECKYSKCKVKILSNRTHRIDEETDLHKIRNVQIEDLLGHEPIVLNRNEVKKYIDKKVVLVSGGGGSIGSELCRQIVEFSPSQLLILDNNENGAYEVQQEILRKSKNKIDAEIIIGSVQDKIRMKRVFEKYKPKVFFHAAAHKHVPILEHNPFEAIKNNIFGTLNCVLLADEYRIDKFILISTDKAVKPINIMGASKRICELVCQEMNKKSETNFAAVRFGNVLGSNGSVLPLFQKQFEEGGPILVTHPEVTRYFMTVDEAVQLILTAGALTQKGEIFVLDMGNPIKIDEIAKDFIRLSGMEPGVDMDIVYTGLRPGEKLYEDLYTEEESLKNTIHEKIFIGKSSAVDSDMFFEQLKSLKTIAENEDIVEFYALIKKMVPNFKDINIIQ